MAWGNRAQEIPALMPEIRSRSQRTVSKLISGRAARQDERLGIFWAADIPANFLGGAMRHSQDMMSPRRTT
jgi:hypothetical protein